LRAKPEIPRTKGDSGTEAEIKGNILHLTFEMKYSHHLIPGRLIRRYMRFLADVRLESGEVVTAHCTNSGSMKSCLEEGAEVYLSPVTDPKRKTRFTWEMIKINGNWVGINTSVPNRLAYEFMKNNIIPGLEGYTEIRREVKYNDSRLDIMATRPGEICFLEVKNVTMKEGDLALFPDAITTRGQKHLQTLMDLKKKGMRAVMLYVVQRMDVKAFAPAEEIDPKYAQLLRQAHSQGVEIIPIQVKVSPEEIVYEKVMEVVGV
jgi:sugar fermentation stimulation protein A